MSHHITEQFLEHQREKCELCGGEGYIYVDTVPGPKGEPKEIVVKCEHRLEDYELD
jgi:hypothetical protein